MKPLLITLLFMTTITISCRRSINDATGTVADKIYSCLKTSKIPSSLLRLMPRDYWGMVYYL